MLGYCRFIVLFISFQLIINKQHNERCCLGQLILFCGRAVQKGLTFVKDCLYTKVYKQPFCIFFYKHMKVIVTSSFIRRGRGDGLGDFQFNN